MKENRTFSAGSLWQRSKAFLSLSRPRTRGAFIPELDGLRFLAITLVVLHHNHWVLRNVLPSIDDHGLLWQAYRTMTRAGGLGVPLFFVISGIVLGLPFARARFSKGQEISLRQYFFRRVRRLEPPYIINLTLLFLLMIAAGGMEVFQERLPNYLASLVYLHNTIFNEWSAINFVAWSLEVEAQFYVLAPLLALVFLLRRANVRFILMLAVIAVMSLNFMYFLDGPFRFTYSILAMGQYFIAGLWLADLLANGRLYAKVPSVGFDLLALAAFVVAVAFDLGVPSKEFYALGVFPILLFFVALFRGRILLAVFRSVPVFTIGGMCYTIYLYHFWIMQAPTRAFGLERRDYSPYEVMLLDVAMLALVFAVSAVLFVLFERPFMNRTRK